MASSRLRVDQDYASCSSSFATQEKEKHIVIDSDATVWPAQLREVMQVAGILAVGHSKPNIRRELTIEDAKLPLGRESWDETSASRTISLARSRE